LASERIAGLLSILWSLPDPCWVKALVALVEIEEESGLLILRVGRVVDLTKLDDSFDAQGADDRDFDLARDEFVGGRLHDDGGELLDFLHFRINGCKELQRLQDVRLAQVLILMQRYVDRELLLAHLHVPEEGTRTAHNFLQLRIFIIRLLSMPFPLLQRDLDLLLDQVWATRNLCVCVQLDDLLL